MRIRAGSRLRGSPSPIAREVPARMARRMGRRDALACDPMISTRHLWRRIDSAAATLGRRLGRRKCLREAVQEALPFLTLRHPISILPRTRTGLSLSSPTTDR